MVYSTRCPGKINLGLRILGERNDGFHELDTIFCQCALADLLEFQPGFEELTLIVDSQHDIGKPEQNLVIRATREFANLTGIRITGTWNLHKNIPPAAGLGGGSIDAAAALRILQEKYNAPIDREDLFKSAAHIGADVPFFLLGGMARGRGKGDRLERLAWPGSLYIILLIDTPGLSTADVYEQYRSGVRPDTENSIDLVAALRGMMGGECRIVDNDLSPAAYALRPELGNNMDILSQMEFTAVGLSGSGPTSYGITSSSDYARKSANQLRNLGYDVILTRYRPTVPRIVIHDS